jgi:hypothetical protein
LSLFQGDRPYTVNLQLPEMALTPTLAQTSAFMMFMRKSACYVRQCNVMINMLSILYLLTAVELP